MCTRESNTSRNEFDVIILLGLDTDPMYMHME